MDYSYKNFKELRIYSDYPFPENTNYISIKGKYYDYDYSIYYRSNTSFGCKNKFSRDTFTLEKGKIYYGYIINNPDWGNLYYKIGNPYNDINRDLFVEIKHIQHPIVIIALVAIFSIIFIIMFVTIIILLIKLKKEHNYDKIEMVN